MNNIYLLYGSNKHKIDKAITSIKKESAVDSFNISVFDAEESPYQNALADASSMPFLGDNRVVIIKNCFFFNEKNDSPDAFYTDLLTYVENPLATSILVLVAPYKTVLKKNKVIELIKKNGEVDRFDDYTREEITYEVAKFLESENHQIEIAAHNELIERLSNDSENYQNEIEKLKIYLAPGEKITYKIIDDVISKDPNDKIYLLSSAIIKKERKKAIETYYGLIENGIVPAIILKSIATKFSEILYTKELIKTKATKQEISKALSVSEGKAYYLMDEAKGIKYKELSPYIKAIIDLEYKIKTGQIDDGSGLELFLLQL